MNGEQLSRQRVQIINEKRFAELAQVQSASVVTHYGLQEMHGLDQLADALQGFDAFPDLHTSVEALIVEGDRVGLRYLSRGTHLGTFMGIAPTGRTVVFGGASINHIRDGQIVETWTVDDLSALMRQIGDGDREGDARAGSQPFPSERSSEGTRNGEGSIAADLEAGRQLVHRWIELTNAHAFAELAEVFAEDLVLHPGEGLEDVRGFPAFRELLESFYVGMPDLQITIEDTVSAGDTLIMRSTSRATHTGELFGIPASGRELIYTGVSTYRILGGKLAVEWFNDDLFGLMHQLSDPGVAGLVQG